MNLFIYMKQLSLKIISNKWLDAIHLFLFQFVFLEETCKHEIHINPLSQNCVQLFSWTFKREYKLSSRICVHDFGKF